MKTTYPCVTCGTLVERVPSNSKGRVFCSRKCVATANKGQPSQNKGKRGTASTGWKGGRREKNGYIYLHIHDHPMADKNGYVAEHRKVASEMMGRPLESHEHVHHRNLDRSDNRPENLVVVMAPDHAHLHATSGDWFGRRKAIYPWSPHASACIECGTTERKHNGHGKCQRCYMREYARQKRAEGYIAPSRRK